MTTTKKKTAPVLSVAAIAAFCGVFSGTNATAQTTAQTPSATRTAQKASAKAEELYRKGRELAFGLNGKKVDGARGFKLLKEATEAGSLDAQADLASLYYAGCEGTPSDKAEAFELAFEPAQAGNPVALATALECYAVKQNSERVAELKAKLVERRDEIDATEDPRGALYVGVVAGDENLVLAAVETESAEAARVYGQVLIQAGATEKAIATFRRAAEQDDPESLYNLGCVYFHGLETEKDLEKSFEYFKQAADKNFPQAIASVALAYELGLGVEKDASEALRQWRRGALRNEPSAMVKTARFERETGNYEKAFDLLRRAAKLGNGEAYFQLSASYLEGKGTTQAPGAAKNCLKRALELGYEPAKEFLRELESMTNR